MVGINPGLIWSLTHRPQRYYRTFTIKTGRKIRQITAPKIALKIIQKWLGYHFSRAVVWSPHVYGFVPGRCHIEAAYAHIGADWALSVDISNFFSTTPHSLVVSSLTDLGYDDAPADLIASLTCFNGCLAQGAPSSPSLSNICFRSVDAALVHLSELYECTLTRYADDIVFSGRGSVPQRLRSDLTEIFEATPWRLAADKDCVQPYKGRIKIHGLVIGGDGIRLTKGYRNKIRAYEHILRTRGGAARGWSELNGHVQYAKRVSRKLNRIGVDGGIVGLAES
jgi:hypothetical protein